MYAGYAELSLFSHDSLIREKFQAISMQFSKIQEFSHINESGTMLEP